MEKIENFDIKSVNITDILLAVTSEPDYDMTRIYITESNTVIEGWHCSCYGFDETSWEAIEYTEEEINALMKSWLSSYLEVEKHISTLWFALGYGK